MRKQISVLLALTLAITSFSGCMGNKPKNIDYTEDTEVQVEIPSLKADAQ